MLSRGAGHVQRTSTKLYNIRVRGQNRTKIDGQYIIQSHCWKYRPCMKNSLTENDFTKGADRGFQMQSYGPLRAFKYQLKEFTPSVEVILGLFAHRRLCMLTLESKKLHEINKTKDKQHELRDLLLSINSPPSRSS